MLLKVDVESIVFVAETVSESFLHFILGGVSSHVYDCIYKFFRGGFDLTHECVDIVFYVLIGSFLINFAVKFWCDVEVCVYGNRVSVFCAAFCEGAGAELECFLPLLFGVLGICL